MGTLEFSAIFKLKRLKLELWPRRWSEIEPCPILPQPLPCGPAMRYPPAASPHRWPPPAHPSLSERSAAALPNEHLQD